MENEKDMAKEFKFGMTVQNTKDTGKTIKRLAKVD